MKAWERERRLLERLQEQGSLALTEACALTGASVATTRRDFELLQEKGLAQRTHGGLQLPKKEEPKGYLQGTAILNHTDEEKYRIAQEAAASVKAGESVFLGAGKTCNMLASMLQNVERLTVVTTSITAVSTQGRIILRRLIRTSAMSCAAFTLTRSSSRSTASIWSAATP